MEIENAPTVPVQEPTPDQLRDHHLIESASIEAGYYLPTLEAVVEHYSLATVKSNITFDNTTDIPYWKGETGSILPFACQWDHEKHKPAYRFLSPSIYPRSTSFSTYTQKAKKRASPYGSRPTTPGPSHKTPATIQTEQAQDTDDKSEPEDVTIHIPIPQTTVPPETPIPPEPITYTRPATPAIPTTIHTMSNSDKGPPIANPTAFYGNDR